MSHICNLEHPKEIGFLTRLIISYFPKNFFFFLFLDPSIIGETVIISELVCSNYISINTCLLNNMASLMAQW